MVIFSVVSFIQIICLLHIPLFNLNIYFQVVLTSLCSLMAFQLCSEIILITPQSVIISGCLLSECSGKSGVLGQDYVRERAYTIYRGSLKNDLGMILK